MHINQRRSWLELDEHEIGRPHARMKNPLYPVDQQGNVVGLETLAWELYDYYQVAVNTLVTRQALFTISEGQQYTAAGGLPFSKTVLHTNMQGQGAVLPNPQRFMTKALRRVFRPDTNILDAVAFDYRTVFTFRVGDSHKEYAKGLLAGVPSASGFTGIGTPANNALLLTQGWPINSNLYSLLADSTDPGVEILQGQNFDVVIDPTQDPVGVYTTQQAPAIGIINWFYLVGALTRSVQ
jgi:hypothetical protein